jgi:hypothetical protein
MFPNIFGDWVRSRFTLLLQDQKGIEFRDLGIPPVGRAATFNNLVEAGKMVKQDIIDK